MGWGGGRPQLGLKATPSQCWYSVAQPCRPCNSTGCSPPGSPVHGDSPGKNTGVGCQAPLQGIFPTQRWNPSLPHCRLIRYHLSPQGSPAPLRPTWILSSAAQSVFQEDLVPIWACIKKGEIEISFGRCNHAGSCPAPLHFSKSQYLLQIEEPGRPVPQALQSS